MISIIVSSYKPLFFNQFKNSVAETIGAAFEIIKVDNPGKMGICEAYNQGAKLANFPYLCFCHEDIVFKTRNWGNIVIDYFKKDNELGLIGVAGSSYKTVAPGSYYSLDPDCLYTNIYQTTINSTISSDLLYSNPGKKKDAQAVCLDGVWLFTTKEVSSQISFDDTTFKNYHCYDLDFSLSVSLHYKLAVTFDVLIEHFSRGSFDKTWINESIKLSSKWKNRLPISTESTTSKYRDKMEKNTLIDFFVKMSENSYGPIEMVKLYRFLKNDMNLSFCSRATIYYTLLKQSIKYVIKSLVFVKPA